MADLTARQREALPDSAFAYIDSAGLRRLPINDEAHVRNALARFNRVDFEDEAARDRARRRLLAAAKRHRIVPLGFIDGQLKPRLPTGRLTLLFADLEGSSQLLAELDDRYGPVLSAVRRTLRTAVRGCRGHEVDARADEYFAVFEDPDAAVSAAVAAQRAMAGQRWPAERPVRVRIGLHTGRPTLTATGYVGIAVNAGARICAAAHGGQTVMSLATVRALQDAPAFELRSLGAHRLRGIAEAHELFAVAVPGLAGAIRPLRSDC